jgi:glycosyltransferase involved in cell wall biosynthesis
MIRDKDRRPFVLDLIGDGPQRTLLEKLVRELNLSDIVRFHGWLNRDSLRTHYQEADIVINPSRYEGMPNVLLEAMACGKPVLASRVAGNESVVIDGLTGWLFDLDDRKGFSKIIDSLLGDSEVLGRMGKSARNHAEQRFSWAAATRAYLRLFDPVLAASNIT